MHRIFFDSVMYDFYQIYLPIVALKFLCMLKPRAVGRLFFCVWRNLKNRHHVEDLGIDGRMKLRWILSKQGGDAE
jgi:hypothetical protein